MSHSSRLCAIVGTILAASCAAPGAALVVPEGTSLSLGGTYSYDSVAIYGQLTLTSSLTLNVAGPFILGPAGSISGNGGYTSAGADGMSGAPGGISAPGGNGQDGGFGGGGGRGLSLNVLAIGTIDIQGHISLYGGGGSRGGWGGQGGQGGGGLDGVDSAEPPQDPDGTPGGCGGRGGQGGQGGFGGDGGEACLRSSAGAVIIRDSAWIDLMGGPGGEGGWGGFGGDGGDGGDAGYFWIKDGDPWNWIYVPGSVGAGGDGGMGGDGGHGGEGGRGGLLSLVGTEVTLDGWVNLNGGPGGPGGDGGHGGMGGQPGMGDPYPYGGGPGMDGLSGVPAWGMWDGMPGELYIEIIPEPATLALAALGGLATLRHRRTRNPRGMPTRKPRAAAC